MQTLVSWYTEQINLAKLNFDNAQLALLQELDKFLESFASSNFITRLWRNEYKLGYYIYGDVGRGKSMIMNAMYQVTPTDRKKRSHFHEFMYDIQQGMAKLTDINDPLAIIAKQLKSKFDIIYLDEMHVSDIATAMIMKRLLESLFTNKIYIVTSSNYHPDELWPNGLMRERFLPAIKIIKDRLNVLSLNSQQDYRLLNDSANDFFIIQANDSNSRLKQIFTNINANNHLKTNSEIEICSRKIKFIQEGKAIIWFNFNVICGEQRSQLDYLELSTRFEWVIISDIYLLTLEQKDIAQRFTWLIDILYDNNCKLSLSSAVPIENIYLRRDFASEFERTISRLEEMRTKEYCNHTVGQ